MRALALIAATLLVNSAALAAAKPKKAKAGAKKPVPTAPAAPAWTSQPPQMVRDASGRAFVAPGQADGAHPDQAEDAARQQLGTLVARWQERTLRCAQKPSEAQVHAHSDHTKGALLDLTVETATSIALYAEKVVDHAAIGGREFVLMRHDLGAMVDGIASDSSRSPDLREAVKRCGEQAFDELARP